MFGLRKKHRKVLIKRTFPDAWLGIINDRVPYFYLLPEDLQIKLKGIIQILLDEKTFEGCGGLKMTDEIRVTIAVQAGILLLGDISDYYPALYSILVYPHSYFADYKSPQPDGTVIEGVQPRSGESWDRGNVVLSWNHTLNGAADPFDGHNLVFHEFAHQLDYEYRATNNGLLTGESTNKTNWINILEQEYYRLIDQLSKGFPTLIDPYAATNLAEFFAVSTELFFEKPMDLRSLHTDWFQQLKLFYNQNPIVYMH